MKRIVLPLGQCLTLALALVLAGAARTSGSEVIHWNRIAVDATTQAMPDNPLSESRILAIVHLAIHDAANTIAPHFETYRTASPEESGGSVDAAVAAAAHTTLRALLPDQATHFDREFAARAARMADDSSAKLRGVAVGKRIGAHLLELRSKDGSDDFTSRAGGVLPGEYRPTPPDFTPAALSNWGKVQPFALTAPHQFRPTPPPSVGSPEARADLDEVRLLGGSASKQRSFEQSEIACYWYEHSTRGWNRIAREVAQSRNLDLWQQARLLALVNVAMADGFIAGFEAKDHYHHWRPATAIRENGDAQWLSFLPTPPVPDYPSTHTVLGAAAATVMARCLGTDYVPFSMTSGGPFPNITRRFYSLSQAAQENGNSRVLAGIHFSQAVHAGYRQGTEVGAWVAANRLRPLEMTGALRTAGN